MAKDRNRAMAIVDFVTKRGGNKLVIRVKGGVIAGTYTLLLLLLCATCNLYSPSAFDSTEATPLLARIRSTQSVGHVGSQHDEH